MSGPAEVRDARDAGAFITAALDDYPLTATEFRVYCRILRRAGARNSHWESNARTAEDLHLGERTVREAKALLVAAGLVTKEHRSGSRARYLVSGEAEWAADDDVARLRAETRRPDTRRAVPTTAVPTTAVPVTGDRGPHDRATAVVGTREGTPLKVLPEGKPPLPPHTVPDVTAQPPAVGGGAGGDDEPVEGTWTGQQRRQAWAIVHTALEQRAAVGKSDVGRNKRHLHQLVSDLLRAGRDPAEIIDAMVECRSITANALDYLINEKAESRPRRQARTCPDCGDTYDGMSLSAHRDTHPRRTA